MNILLCLAVAMLGSAAAQIIQDDGDKQCRSTRYCRAIYTMHLRFHRNIYSILSILPMKLFQSPSWTTPPDYNISLITAPVHLFYGQNDWLVAEQDMTQLYGELANPIEMYLISYTKWSHLDFVYGKDARSLVYGRIVDTLANSYGLPSSCS